jgi:hypothetical protein
VVEEAFANIRTVKAFASEQTEFKKFSGPNEDAYGLGRALA